MNGILYMGQDVVHFVKNVKAMINDNHRQMDYQIILMLLNVLNHQKDHVVMMLNYCCLMSWKKNYYCIMRIKIKENSYKISKWAKPLSDCSSKHVIWLLSSCRLLNEGAPLNNRRPIAVRSLCDKSLNWKKFFILIGFLFLDLYFYIEVLQS